MTSTAVLETRLADAEAALHSLLTGVKEVSVSYNGQSVTFTQATAGQLRGYIAELKIQLGQTPPRRSFGISF
jgi:hypothetical protein